MGPRRGSAWCFDPAAGAVTKAPSRRKNTRWHSSRSNPPISILGGAPMIQPPAASATGGVPAGPRPGSPKLAPEEQLRRPHAQTAAHRPAEASHARRQSNLSGYLARSSSAGRRWRRAMLPTRPQVTLPTGVAFSARRIRLQVWAALLLAVCAVRSAHCSLAAFRKGVMAGAFRHLGRLVVLSRRADPDSMPARMCRAVW